MIALLVMLALTRCDDSHYLDAVRVCDGFTGKCEPTGQLECRWKPRREQ